MNMDPTERPLKPSDVVKSVNGGPEMTVQSVTGDNIVTIWWDSSAIRFEVCQYPRPTLLFVRECKDCRDAWIEWQAAQEPARGIAL